MSFINCMVMVIAKLKNFELIKNISTKPKLVQLKLLVLKNMIKKN